MRRREFMKLSVAGAAGGLAMPTMTKAQTAFDCNMTNQARLPRRIIASSSCGVMIDVQESFLMELDGSDRSRITRNTLEFSRLLGHFKIPIVATLEKPVTQKGSLPQEVREQLGSLAGTFEKSFFDLSKEQKIRDHLASLNKTQLIVTGCETDVCVLESCLGLLGLGYEVFLIENLLFSSSRHVDSAIVRMRAEGATFLTYKSLYFALTEQVETQTVLETSTPVTKDLPQ